MPRIVTVLSFLLLIHLPLCSQEIAEGDTCAMETPHQSRHQLKNKFLNRLYEKVKDFSRVDTNYIEPQKYNYTFMLQNTRHNRRYGQSLKPILLYNTIDNDDESSRWATDLDLASS